MPSLLEIVQYSSVLSALIPICTGFRLRGLIWYYVCLSFLADVIIFYLRQTGAAHHHDGYIAATANCFLLVQYCLIAGYLCSYVFIRRPRLACTLSLFLPSVYFIIHTLSTSPKAVNFDDATILYGILILLCLLALYRVIQNIAHVRIEHSAPFFVAAGFLLYASGTLLMILFSDYLVAKYPPVVINKIWGFHNLLSIVINLVFAWAFILQKPAAKGDI